ncbi:MAG: TlpA family protein disulfide reductase [Candidatus Limnocylindrales bacterium]
MGGVWLYTRSADDGPRVAIGQPAPAIEGTTLDGQPFTLSAYAGRPVILNFWGPSCVPCRDEFPLMIAKLSEHAAEGLAIVGVLTDDPPEPARRFVADYGATWPTVDDPGARIKTTYRVVARPHTFFIDGAGTVQAQQIGEMRDEDFERYYQRIAP